jgi:hypothetical protein
MLLLSILGILTSQGEASKTENMHYKVLQGLLKGGAAGVELAESVAVGVELSKMREASQRRRKRSNLTFRIVEDGLRELEYGRNTVMELNETLFNCTATATNPRELNAGKEVMFGLQIMGVFTLCGLLATLG